MPLPTDRGLAWPPVQLATITPAMDRWSAWYGGDALELDRVYRQQRERTRPSDRPSTYRGGLVGAVARTFWGAPRGDLTQAKQQIHVPIAADLCQASADLLFSEPPTITVEDKTTNGRLADLVDDGMLGTLAEAAEIGAALGSSYIRTTWDTNVVSDRPFFTSVDADGAWPEFRYGRLTAVTFWWVVRSDDETVWRHLERHELNPLGEGVVLHGLYQGTRDRLGSPMDLAADPSTAGLQPLVRTLTPGLAVSFIPNQRPQRRWRHDPIGRNLGRSDLDGIEGAMDALDETMTSWMRDIRLGKARVFVSRDVLEGNGPGRGAMWDEDREVYSPLDVMAARETAAGGLPIQAEQFAIRFAEHSATAAEWRNVIIRTAGYSSQTFGDSGGAGGDRQPEATATEIRARERRSYMTRDRKIRAWRPGLSEALEKLLAVDAVVFKSGVKPERPKIVFGDAVQESPLVLAQTAQALRVAEAASDETLVTMIHPDWTDDEVSAEVAKIQAERATTVPDPTGFDPTAADDAAGIIGQ